MEYILGIIIVAQIVVSYLERKDFNDRLMAKNFQEYKDNTVKEEPNKLPDSDGMIPLEDAEDILNGES